jgi:hypothetical protein
MLESSKRARVTAGKALREKVPRKSHAEWTVPADRPDPIGLLQRLIADGFLSSCLFAIAECSYRGLHFVAAL